MPRVAAPDAGRESAPLDAYRDVDAAALARLKADADATASDALIVRQAGKPLLQVWFSASRAPIQSMSITKSVLALVTGCLVDAGKLRLDDPVASFFPAWKDSKKNKITVAHLLTHSSGLDEGKSTAEIYRAKSFVEHSLGSELVAQPGTHYEYGNRAANLLAGVIARASRKSTEQATQQCLFEPLGITRFSWTVDARGQAHGLAGLHMLPEDLAKLGELVLGRGRYGERQVLSAAWIARITELPAPIEPPHKPMSWLWWRLPERTDRVIDDGILERWRAVGVPESIVQRVAPLKDKPFDSSIGFVKALRDVFGDTALKLLSEEVYAKKLPDARYSFGRFVGSYAHGSLGQFLVVVPEQKLVAVRMRRPPKRKHERKDVEKSFPDFPDRVVALTRPPPAD
jgi:CubicO group peptidase (beta-lactamase class C family)